jgi:hypothetical protein
MHVLQRIAVIADNKDEAFQIVKSTLESELGNNDYSSNAWFDWFVTGGGRWNPTPDSQYNDDEQSMTLSYEGERNKFLEAVNEGIEARINEFNLYRKSFNEKDVDINAYLDRYDGKTDYSFDLYPLSKMIEMTQGHWDFNSYFYDMHHASTNTKFMFDSIDRGVDNWYIVFVDFHF